jgi:hypothetical protein
MKRRGVVIGAVCICIAVLLFAFMLIHRAHISDSHQTNTEANSSQKSATANSNGSSSPAKSAESCAKLFPAGDARKVLDAQAKPVVSTSRSSTDIATTTCSYTDGTAIADVTAHLYKTHVGAATNDVEFGSGRPKTAITVSGYGDAAFWLKNTHTLHVLKTNNWYEISAGSLQNAEKAAKLMLSRMQ